MSLFHKYNVPAPRYTSYPTVPFWDEKMPSLQEWKDAVGRTFLQSNEKEGISVYIHLPYCESLCTYCGCNTRITVNHSVEKPYVDAVLKEWKLYASLFPGVPKIKEIHLGGGTPTFFSSSHLERLISGILENSLRVPDAAFSIEGHPQSTTPEHLRKLYRLGFRRISFGIQDFDPRVQEVINRRQSFEQVMQITAEARDMGFVSINYDLIYGLPLQNEQSITLTIEKVNRLRPDRIAFYSYAHVPWMKPAQKKFEELLPSGEEKRKLYELGRSLLETSGYEEIGMDHFALPGDALCLAASTKKLHRSFMGYTDNHTQLLIGLGVSSISDAWEGFMQNEKTVEGYLAMLSESKLPLVKGHLLTAEDLVIRRHILNIMCHYETSWSSPDMQHPTVDAAIERLKELVLDGLIILAPAGLLVTTKGRAFLRNICMAFDARLWRNQPKQQLFSQAV